MNLWPSQLARAAVSMTLLAFCARVAIRAWSREPHTSYRVLVLALWLGLLFPATQLAFTFAAHILLQKQTSVSNTALQQAKFDLQVIVLNSGGRTFRQVIQKPRPETAARLQAPDGSSSPINDLSTAVFIAYCLGLVTMAAYQLARLFRTQRFLARCSPLAQPELQQIWEELSAASPLAKRVHLLISEEAALPSCWGVFRKYLVLPARVATLPPDALGWSMRHELVHLERRDARTALLQMLLLCVHWYNPAAWWLSRRLDWWREASCDALVVERSGRPRSYALALVDFARASLQPPPSTGPSLVHSAISRSHLRERLELLDKNRRPFSPLQRRIAWSATAIGLSLLASLQIGAEFVVLQSKSTAPPVRALMQREEQFRQVLHFKTAR
jgi:beta-lactamase regulating signal transducer with metallopeptidase domain